MVSKEQKELEQKLAETIALNKKICDWKDWESVGQHQIVFLELARDLISLLAESGLGWQREVMPFPNLTCTHLVKEFIPLEKPEKD